MNIQDLEELSAYFDEEAQSPQALLDIFEIRPEHQKIYDDFRLIAQGIQESSENFLASQEEQLATFWSRVETQIEQEETFLNETLQNYLVDKKEV